MALNRDASPYLVLAVAALATLAVHFVLLPPHFPADRLHSVGYLLVGWPLFAAVFYALGRIVSDPGALPSTRAGDAGIALFIGSVIVVGALDAGGLRPEESLVIYALPAVGLYAGLALIGWSLGRRSEAIERIAEE